MYVMMLLLVCSFFFFFVRGNVKDKYVIIYSVNTMMGVMSDWGFYSAI